MAKNTDKIKRMTYTALFAVVIAICSWIAVPATVPFTLQSFAVFAALTILGGKYGLFAIVLYIVLGAVGLPVFSNFTGGIGVLFGPTGGYIFGFVAMAILYWLITHFFGERLFVRVAAIALGLVVCYALGTVQFMTVYSMPKEQGLWSAFSMCVLPFIVPDIIKIALAFAAAGRLSRYIKLKGENI
ncbi:MAG: biotin transporter BioY [Clostridia bacterium]|nr:biotin transporter BioY [Clostridia bacterium]